MTQVITLEGYRPTPRYDDLPWTEARIEEGETADGPWVELETITLDPVDADPSNPATRNFTTELASDADDLWYRVVFIDGSGDELIPTDPVQNGTAQFGTMYATVSELARILKIRSPSPEETAAMERVLLAAAGEINSEIDLADDSPALAGWQIALAAEVNLERAVEHWQQGSTPFGLIGLGVETGVAFASADSWKRHANKLAPLKAQWGFA